MRKVAQRMTETFSRKAKASSESRRAAALSPREATWIAWSLCALSLGLAALGLFLLVLSKEARPAVPVFEQWAEDAVVRWASRRSGPSSLSASLPETP